jgi:hypothetical protein
MVIPTKKRSLRSRRLSLNPSPNPLLRTPPRRSLSLPRNRPRTLILP